MRIVCPECSATYEVSETLLGTDRPVQCARCGHQWLPRPVPAEHPPPPEPFEPLPPFPHAPPPPHAPPAPAPPPHVPASAGPIPAGLSDRAIDPEHEPGTSPHRLRGALWSGWGEGRREATLVRLAWAASVLVIVLIGWAAFTWRGDIIQAWPPSERLYAVLGLA